MSNNNWRLAAYLDVISRFCQGEYQVDLPQDETDEIGNLGQVLTKLGRELEKRAAQAQKLNQLVERANAGLTLEDILEAVYQDFLEVIPYNRIGLALIEGAEVRSRWLKSDQGVPRLGVDYRAHLEGSSLQTIIQTNQPRILNDLPLYLVQHPNSDSTRLIVSEGFSSSLTCPLIANGAPIGFLFFSSIYPNTYAGGHIDIFKQIANELSIIVERGRLVSNLAQQKSEIECKNKELSRLNEMRNFMLGIAAHDLRTPLSFIQTSTDLMMGDEGVFSVSQNVDLLEGINRQARHMLAMLDSLLDFTELEAGRSKLYIESLDLPVLLKEVIYQQARQAERKNITITLEMDRGEPIMADPIRIRQVIENLVSNAVKYSPLGSQVSVSARWSKAGWVVHVSDQGPGVKESDREKLFQPFTRLSARPTGGEKSVGLGLAIAHWVIEKHGGQIGVDSQPGSGATFWFTLPVFDG